MMMATFIKKTRIVVRMSRLNILLSTKKRALDVLFQCTLYHELFRQIGPSVGVYASKADREQLDAVLKDPDVDQSVKYWKNVSTEVLVDPSLTQLPLYSHFVTNSTWFTFLQEKWVGNVVVAAGSLNETLLHFIRQQSRDVHIFKDTTPFTPEERELLQGYTLQDPISGYAHLMIRPTLPSAQLGTSLERVASRNDDLSTRQPLCGAMVQEKNKDTVSVEEMMKTLSSLSLVKEKEDSELLTCSLLLIPMSRGWNATIRDILTRTFTLDSVFKRLIVKHSIKEDKIGLHILVTYPVMRQDLTSALLMDLIRSLKATSSIKKGALCV